MKPPSSDECTARAVVEIDGKKMLACWYPQMGGYVGKCLVEILPTLPNGYCFEAYVWHDGEFPFEAGQPRQLHHCMAAQFIQFGEQVKAFADGLADAAKEKS